MGSPLPPSLRRILAPPREPGASAGERGMLRRLAATLAHNVNNALTGVIGYLELALGEAPAAGKLRMHLESSLACAHRAAEAVRRIVAFAGRASLPEALIPLSLREAAVGASRRVHRLTPEGTITVAVAGEAPAWAWASDLLLETTLDLLLQNAVEAMPGGGSVILHAAEEDGRALLIVRDSGPGVAPEALAHLFEPFHTTKSSGHLGLGLALCREMVQLQGGDVEVATAPGCGTTVTLSFPAAEASLRPLALPARREDGHSPTASSPWPTDHVPRLAM